MKHWKELIQSARGMAHLVAAGTTLLFALPLGAYLVHQQLSLSAQRDADVARHAALHVRMLDDALERASTATRLLADALPARSPAQLLTVGQSIIKVSGIISRLEVTRNGELPFIVTLDHAQATTPDSSQPLLDGRVRVGL
ncbi:MAG TPA: hypothetical protein VFY24_05170, partial [Azospira sp.]|nr:hypothetical protein [Azospira sp.]